MLTYAAVCCRMLGVGVVLPSFARGCSRKKINDSGAKGAHGALVGARMAVCIRTERAGATGGRSRGATGNSALLALLAVLALLVQKGTSVLLGLSLSRFALSEAARASGATGTHFTCLACFTSAHGTRFTGLSLSIRTARGGARRGEAVEYSSKVPVVKQQSKSTCCRGGRGRLDTAGYLLY